MRNFKKLALGAALGLGLTAPVLAQETTADTVVATVNGTELTVGHVIAMVGTLAEQDRQLPDDVLFKGLLDRLIQQTAVSQSATEVPLGVELQLQNERSSLIAGNVVNAMAAKIDVTEEKVQAAYDEKFADFVPEMEFNASHILVATEDEAKTIITALEGGADFADEAKANSTGPTGPNGGNLGWFGKGRMVPEFEEAVTTLEKGQISGPVQTQFGWHVIKLIDTRVPDVPTLDVMQKELETEVWRQEMLSGIEAIVGAADVQRPDISGIDPAVLRDLSLIGY